MLKYFLFISLLLSFSISSKEEHPPIAYSVDKVLEATINSSINPATLNYLRSSFKKSKTAGFDLILIKLNTPGGLVTTTKDILHLFGESELPIVIWITPEGGSATSAGAILASAAHVLVMSDATNIGAATPINMGGDIKEDDLRSKAINDLVALVGSQALARGRNKKAFELMVSEAKSYHNTEAKKLKIIDGVVNSHKELKKLLHDFKVKTKNKEKTLKIDPQIEFVKVEMDLGQKLLDIFANPNLAYILFLLGAALLYLELQAPGGFLAGGLGTLCLLLAGISFQVLPLNIGALALIILSFILFIIEIYITSYGILTISGLASLIFGSMFLYRTDDAYLEISQGLIFSTVAAILIFVLLMAYIISRDHKNIGKKSFNKHIGLKAKIIEKLESEDDTYTYHIKVNGEIWKAKSEKNYSLDEWVTILEQDDTNIFLKI